jgi:hypothetical protein
VLEPARLLALLSTEQFLLRQLPVALAAIVFLELVQAPRVRQALGAARARAPLPARWSTYATFVLGCVLLGVHRETQFIYFQF